jgi:phosphatidylserine/phosphatidylglycerophosphate/cardiolipin synthase-like enzyme
MAKREEALTPLTNVAVTVILDKSQRAKQYSSADFLAHADIPTYIDPQHAIADNKVMLIDGATLVTGSFNFTRAARECRLHPMTERVD